MQQINRVAVLGAGTMGGRIAAHMANAGVPSLLLDVPALDPAMPNRIAAAGLEAAKTSEPAAFFDPSLAELITIGNFEDDLPRLQEVDWIVEAVVENLEIKRSLLQRVEAFRKPGTAVTTNTSGLSIAMIAQGFSQDFRRCWFGTHFFNPPRYMRLLEVIRTPETDRALLDAVSHFAEVRLGKGIVAAKDTPNFIANRIGTFSVLNIMRLMQEMDLTIEEVDALTGRIIGWPKSATFRTIDLVGLDVLGSVAGNQPQAGDRMLLLPDFLQQMLQRKWLGDKAAGGFYKRAKDGSRLVLDWRTLEYRPPQKLRLGMVDLASPVDDVRQRLRMLLEANGRASQFLWSILSDLWSYSADCVPEICDSIADIDRAMRLGFNWELGPFEMWDAVGVERSAAHIKSGQAHTQKLLASEEKSWYSGHACFAPGTASYEPIPIPPPGVGSVAMAQQANRLVKKNPGASLIDVGEGIACFEFHSKMNTIGGDVVSLISQTLKPGGPGDPFDAFVIMNDAPNFSAGANLTLLLLWAQDEEWEEIDLAIRQFQAMTQAIKFSPKPVVIAPFGLTLGGACEMSLHAAARQPHCELYMGLVEAAVGLLPAGGGLKEMLLRALSVPEPAPQARGERQARMVERIGLAFEIIATAKVSNSANQARSFQFLSPSDPVTMNRERLLPDVKRCASELVRSGYRAPKARHDIPAPGESVVEIVKQKAQRRFEQGMITEYEARLAAKIGQVLCGGNVAAGTVISEQHMLDLEREAFQSLCGESKTRERMQHMLKTGKPLRN